MQRGYYRWVVDIPFLKNILPTTAHFHSRREDNLLVRSYDRIIMSAPPLFLCGENQILTWEINCLGIKQQALRQHADIYFPGLQNTRRS